MERWIKIETEKTTAKLGDYVQRRKAGGPRELFQDRQDAIRWTRESAVVKYVDGSWVHGTFRSTTPQDQRRAARTSWQVLSEELGDGDIERSHVAAYEGLMNKLADEEGSGPAPKGFEDEFVRWLEIEGEQPNKQPWIAALLQLTVTISPEEFLPEILGFNLSYEGLPLHLLITAKELRELRIDPYYFVVGCFS